MAASKSSERQVLPTNVRPSHYDLELEPDFDTCKISGSVSIELDALETSRSITLNVVDIKVEEMFLKCGADLQSPTHSVWVAQLGVSDKMTERSFLDWMKRSNA
jgi:aminopeptidase N